MSAERIAQAPSVHGYYWATNIKYRWRGIVLVDQDGNGHVRAFHHRMSSSSYGLEQFDDWDGPLTDPRKGGKT